MKRESLVAAVNDMNDLFDEAPIKMTTKSTTDFLKDALITVSAELADGDALLQSTVDVLIELECDLPGKLKIKKAPKAEKEAKPTKEKEKPAKGKEKEKPAKEKTPKPAGELSNKSRIYLEWKKGKKDPEKLHQMVDEAVKLATVKIWLKWWEKGINLPAAAKK